MVPSMTYQVLHNLEFAKLNLGSLMFAVAGAAHLPPVLRDAFERRAKNLPFFYEGRHILRHPIALYSSFSGYGLSECVLPFRALAFHRAQCVHLRHTERFFSPLQACMGDV